MARRHRLEGRRADASGLVREPEGESGVRDPSGCEAHARPRAHREWRRTNARWTRMGASDVSDCQKRADSRPIPVVVLEPIGSPEPEGHRGHRQSINFYFGI